MSRHTQSTEDNMNPLSDENEKLRKENYELLSHEADYENLIQLMKEQIRKFRWTI